ncbi:hypothetical protein [Vulcanisaeta distributa]|uniref:Uncharacterized protein n=1 Tax=Vulcanisaeta distributa (strain DSM 14429 / JCM 11212 / NBRC 100878 / IC-017) TaxID=572478 RepID=E1QPL7_VULDI|nr:hypothetical protein [Vulcanisaeta distributa]ADN50313.1 hypothetical protein Vdis_0923 [Vulcanisaeta distributa DSM 14429]
MMTRYTLIIAIALFTAVLVIITSPLTSYSISNYFIMQLNNNINEALSRCGVNPSTTFIVTRTITTTNTSIILDLSLSNNYDIRIIMRLANNQLPVNEVNITIISNNSAICYSTSIPISSASGTYNYVIQGTNYFIELLSYSGSTPIVTNGSSSLLTYGTTINSAIIIPTITGNVICNTGSPSIPIYIVYALGRPIIYVVQPSKPITSILCRYSQSLNSSYLLMALLIGAAAALIYEAALVIMRINRLKIT